MSRSMDACLWLWEKSGRWFPELPSLSASALNLLRVSNKKKGMNLDCNLKYYLKIRYFTLRLEELRETNKNEHDSAHICMRLNLFLKRLLTFQ
jgi:hypothetical protein